VVTSEPVEKPVPQLDRVIAEGRRAREDNQFNRFRLVVQNRNASGEKEKLFQAFEALSNKDERTHVHLLSQR